MIALADDAALYYQVFGRAVRIIAIAETADEANAYMAAHAEASLLAELTPHLLLLADKTDLGVKIQRAK